MMHHAFPLMSSVRSFKADLGMSLPKTLRTTVANLIPKPRTNSSLYALDRRRPICSRFDASASHRPSQEDIREVSL